MPRSQSAATPPVSASGTALKTSRASRGEPRAEYRRKEIERKQTGTTMERRCRARARFSNCPAHASQYPAGNVTRATACSCASATNEAMSLPRTLAATTTRRLPVSRVNLGQIGTRLFPAERHSHNLAIVQKKTRLQNGAVPTETPRFRRFRSGIFLASSALVARDVTSAIFLRQAIATSNTLFSTLPEPEVSAEGASPLRSAVVEKIM